MGGRSSQLNVAAPMIHFTGEISFFFLKNSADTYCKSGPLAFVGKACDISRLQRIFTSMSSHSFSKGGILPGNLMQLEQTYRS